MQPNPIVETLRPVSASLRSSMRCFLRFSVVSSVPGAADRSEVVANGLRLILLRLDCRAADTVLFRQLEFAGEGIAEVAGADPGFEVRSEEHTSELSHVSISYAVFCLKKKMEILYRH